MEPRVLPKTLDYTDVLPLAVESRSRRRTFFPINGQTFSSAGIDFAGGHSFIRRLRVEQSGVVLEDINSYNRLMGAVVLPCQSGEDHHNERSITEGQRVGSQLGSYTADLTQATHSSYAYVCSSNY